MAFSTNIDYKVIQNALKLQIDAGILAQRNEWRSQINQLESELNAE